MVAQRQRVVRALLAMRAAGQHLDQEREETTGYDAAVLQHAISLLDDARDLLSADAGLTFGRRG